LESLETEIYESDLVKLKKENAKKFDAHLKKTQKLVQDSVDAKQVNMAIKALQKYNTQSKKKGEKGLLGEDDASLSVTFTMT
jgi:hypothetical protein